MSKERELLKRLMIELTTQEDVVSLFNDIKECLIQPEQEPVAWKVIDKTNGEYMFSRVKPMERSYKYDVVIPLYTAPPKRKPLTPQQISEGNHSMLNVTREAFKQGVIFAEKAHGIGGV